MKSTQNICVKIVLLPDQCKGVGRGIKAEGPLMDDVHSRL